MTAVGLAAAIVWAQPLAETTAALLFLTLPELDRNDYASGSNFVAGVPAFCLVWLAEWMAWRRGEIGWEWSLLRTGAFGALVFAAGAVLLLNTYHALSSHNGTLRSTAGLDFLFLPLVAWRSTVVGFLVGMGLAAIVRSARIDEHLSNEPSPSPNQNDIERS